MTVAAVIAATLAELPDEIEEIVRQSIRIEVRPAPIAWDLAHGAQRTDRGLFVGYPWRSESDAEGDGELYAEDGDDVAQLEGGDELFAAEGDDVAEVATYKPGGVIVLFTSNIVPLDEVQITQVLLHELAHFLGEDEQSVDEMGLG